MAGFTLLAITAIAIAAIASIAALQFFLTGNTPLAAISGAIVLGSIATLGFYIAMIVKLAKENKRMQVQNLNGISIFSTYSNPFNTVIF